MALSVAPFPHLQNNNWVLDIVQNAAAMRQRQAEFQRNYALQIAENHRREAEAKERMAYERQRADELANQFRINTAFNTGKDIRERAEHGARMQNYAADLAGKKPYVYPGDGSTEPALPSSPELGAVPDPNAPPELPPIPDPSQAAVSPAAAQIGPTLSGAPLGTPPAPAAQIAGNGTPQAPLASRIDPVIRPPVIATPPGASLVPPPGFQTPAKPAPGADPSAQIAQLGRNLARAGVDADTAKRAIAETAKQLVVGDAKISAAGGATELDTIASNFGLVPGENGTYANPSTGGIFNVGVSGGKPFVRPAKAADLGLTPVEGKPGYFTRGASVYKEDSAGNIAKVSTGAKRALTLQGKDGKPINVMTDGSFQNEKGDKIEPDEVRKLTGALEERKVEGGEAKEKRASLEQDRKFFADEAKRARDEVIKLRDDDDKPLEPFAEAGKFYTGPSKKREISREEYDNRKRIFDDYNGRIKAAESRATTFEAKIGEAQRQIDALGGTVAPPAAPLIGAPPATPPAGTPPAAGGKKKAVFKDGKIVYE